MHDDIQHVTESQHLSNYGILWVQVADWGPCAPDLKISQVFGRKLLMNFSPCRCCFEHVWSVATALPLQQLIALRATHGRRAVGSSLGFSGRKAALESSQSGSLVSGGRRLVRSAHVSSVSIGSSSERSPGSPWHRTWKPKKQSWKTNQILLLVLRFYSQVHHGQIITFVWVQCLVPIPAPLGPLQPQGPRVSRRAMAGFDKPIDVPRHLEVSGNMEDQPI